MIKYAALILLISMLAAGLVPHKTAAAQQPGDPNPLYVPDEILVKFKDGAAPALGADFVDDTMLPIGKGRVKELSPALSERRGGPYLIQLDGNTSVEEAVRRAKADPRVEYAEPNYIYKGSMVTPDDALFERMWGLSNSSTTGADIAAPRAWGITTGSNDLVVAIIDSGADLSHQDLARNAWVNPGEVAGNGLDDDGNGLTDDINGWNFAGENNRVYTHPQFDSHGTHIAGTIGAVGNNGKGVAGVAWNVKLMSLKFLDKKDGRGSTADAIRSIYYAMDQRRRGQNVRVINASWSGPGESIALREAVAEAGEAGILFVCAAGNDSTFIDSSPQFPVAWSGALPTMISVASMDELDEVSSFSNLGHATVSVAAPGSRILSTLPENAYGYASGTSMATPHVSGIAALVWASEPGLTPAQVKRRIMATSEPLLTLASQVTSAGRANAYNALTNSVPPVQAPRIGRVRLSKRELVIDGLGFVGRSSVIEVNGAAVSGTRHDDSYAIGNGSLTRLSVEFANKKEMKRAFPKGVPVSISVMNSTTGQRSAVQQITR
ncbi:MAG TPA: S8 family peptidase [Blastocatellia bacterium]|nr:S8 family peptidase [Blastocatellia bacterium]